MNILALSLLLGAFLSVCAGPARANEASERTMAPYFFVEKGDPTVDHLPLEKTSVDIAIHGVMADVTVSQRYENAGERPINLRYVFPASTRAAVHGMQMVIGDQVIRAEVEERERARRTFEQAKRAGRSASLLEQERPNVLSMGVANVMPGDRIDVTLEYTEVLVPEGGTYELVFPTVVGPRYANGSTPKSDDWVASPYRHEGDPSSSAFALSGTLATPIAVRELGSPSHAIAVEQENTNLSRFALASESPGHGNRDFVLRYRLAGDAIQSGLSLYERDGEKYFMLVVEPPSRVEREAIPPREYVFVVDVSGSMDGFPLDTAKRLLEGLVGDLRPSDRFNVLLFAGGSQVLSPRSMAATPSNVSRALGFIDGQRGGGGTEMLDALRRALALSPDGRMSRSFVVITDGFVAADRDVMDHVSRHLGEANVFCFGIGSSVNRFLIEGLARAGLGEPFVVTDPSEAPAASRRFRQYVGAPVLTDIRLETDGFDAYDLEPPSIPDVLAERPIVVHGKWRGEARGAVRLGGLSGAGVYSQRFPIGPRAMRSADNAIRYGWARARLTRIADFAFGDPTEDERRAITELGLSFNLLTRYTSFVAVSRAVRNPGGRSASVAQALPMPAGVSDLAVGGPIQGASEPGLAVLAALACAAMGLGLLRRRAAFTADAA